MNNIKTISILLITILLQSCAIKSHDIFWVSGLQTDCSSGAGKAKCLSINKEESLSEENWELFYANIEGFEFEEGYIKKVKVKKTKKDHPAADESSLKYTLIKELDKTIDNRLVLNGHWTLIKLHANPINRMIKLPKMEIDLNEMRISGNGGCNNYSGTIKKLTFSNIIFGNLLSTKKACLSKNIEQKYLEALVAVKSYKTLHDKLLFYDINEKVVLTFISKSNRDMKTKVTGGWSQAETDQNVKDAASFILNSLNTPSKLKQIINVKKQVVSGMNYDLTLELENGEKWKSIVYRDLSGKFSISEEPIKIK